ncbi:MAG: efflux RND transporter periplasmic adaptor subunit [Acidobacteriota bacterium]
MKRAARIILPLVVLVLAGLAALAMYRARPMAEVVMPEVPLPVVRVQTVHLEDVQLTVNSQGSVSPRTESVLVPEVAGRVIDVAPSFVAGGFFENGDVLLRIDGSDYREAVVEAEAAVAREELRLAQERAEQQIARREWGELGEGEPTPLTVREPQVTEATASVAAARAGLARARRDLARTEIRAPYAGRVRSKTVDIGQYVAPGTALGTIYAIDSAEVRLPLADRELAFLDLPPRFRGEEGDRTTGPAVVLRAEFAGRVHAWQGRIVRTEGEIDPRSRMVHVVVSVDDPYGRGDDPDRPPLAAGMFVDAEIRGRTVSGVAVIPRSAVRGEGHVMVVDDGGRLHGKTVVILRRQGTDVIVQAGLADGDRVCLTLLPTATDRMRVRVEGS